MDERKTRGTEGGDDWIDDYIFHLTHLVLYPPTIKADEE